MLCMFIRMISPRPFKLIPTSYIVLDILKTHYPSAITNLFYQWPRISQYGTIFPIPIRVPGQCLPFTSMDLKGTRVIFFSKLYSENLD